MEHVYHRYYQVNVRRQDSDNLDVVSHYIDRDCEMAGLMRLGAGDFRVREARVEVYRPPADAGPGGVTRLENLHGVMAYPSAIREFRRAMPDDPSGRWDDIFIEGIKGVLQAEAFVWRERGFASMEDYDHWFRQEFADSCYYYSHLNEATVSWNEYVSSHFRAEYLFNRHRYSAVTFNDRDEIEVRTSISDSFHEMGIFLRVNPETLTVVQARAGTLRCPDPVCKEVSARVPGLEGQRLHMKFRKKLQAAAGGPEGCTHLADLITEAAKTLNLAIGGCHLLVVK